MRRQTFYFSDGPYLQAMHGLYSALSSPEAFVKFVGQPRTGKSSVCEKLTQFMQHKGYRVIYFDYAVESPEMLRSILARELDIPDSVNLMRHLESALAKDSDKPLILIFDDVHQLSDITLIEIYQLAGVQVQQKRVINMVLCGGLEFERRLNGKKVFTPLLQHVSHNLLLDPMDAEVTSRFLLAYLQKMEMPGLLLEPGAKSQFFKSCRGFPGAAYALCELLLAIGQAKPQLDRVTKEDLQSAIRSEGAELAVSSVENNKEARRRFAAPIALVIVIASLALLVQQFNPREDAVEQAPLSESDALVESVASPGVASPFATAAAPQNDSGTPPTLSEEATQAVQLDSIGLTRSMLSVDDDEDAEAVADQPVETGREVLPDAAH